MEIIWAFLVVASGFLGYYVRDIKDKIKTLEVKVEKKKDAPVQKKEESPTIIDPLDVVQQAKWEAERSFKELNPDYED